MRKIITCLLLVFSLVSLLFGQKSAEILDEGKLLYRLEKAAWYGADHFAKNFTDIYLNVGGYISYENENSKIINLYFDIDDPFYILLRYEFDSLPKPEPISLDLLDNEASQLEKDLIQLKLDALARIYSKNSFYTFYEDSAPNLIPLIRKGKKCVFVLTGPNVWGVLLLGNDYFLTYNKKNEFKKVEKLHSCLITFPCETQKVAAREGVSSHSHLVSDYINSTDICTLLLYKDLLEWKQHIVLSKKFVSIFDLEAESLFIITRKKWHELKKNKNISVK